jgi:hypothetical protein
MIDEIIIPNTYALRKIRIVWIKLIKLRSGQGIWFEIEGFTDTILFIPVKDYYQVCRDIEFKFLNEFRLSVEDIGIFLDFLRANKERITNGIKVLRAL